MLIEVETHWKRTWGNFVVTQISYILLGVVVAWTYTWIKGDPVVQLRALDFTGYKFYFN